MAPIRKYIAQQQLQPSSMPSAMPRGGQIIGQAVEGLGNAISSMAGQIGKQNDAKAEFHAADQFRALQLQLADDYAKSTEAAAPDGTDFAKNFWESSYKPRTEAFLSGLTGKQREEYATRLAPDGAFQTDWSLRAATGERDRLYAWQTEQIGTGTNELATAIRTNPENYFELRQLGIEQIEKSSLPTSQKQKLLKEWDRQAQMASLDHDVANRPEQALIDLDADPRKLSPQSQFVMLRSGITGASYSDVRAGVTYQESKGDPYAVSHKGAIGLMQVMPATAREISKELGDGLIDKGMSDDRIKAILSNPETNVRYGDYYLKKQIARFGKVGGLEAALIAYNGGPSRAEAWIKSGFDDKVIPKESADYYKKIIARLPQQGGSTQHGTTPGAEKYNAQTVTFKWNRGGDAKVEESKLEPDLVNRVKTSFAALGIQEVKINSGHRDAAHNARAGGAKGSQHIHGKAMDIDVSGMPHSERVRLIQALSANGITGLGIGTNIIHADIGGRRAWGYAKGRSDGGGPVPAWATEAITAHLENRNSVPTDVTMTASSEGRKASPRYASLPYADRQRYIQAAEVNLNKLVQEVDRSTSAERTTLRRQMTNEIASISATGQSTGAFDDTKVSTVFGEDDYLKFINERDTALRTYNATSDMTTLTSDEINQRVEMYAPQAGSPSFSEDQRIHAAVTRKAAEITRLRANDPEKAAAEFEDVKAAKEAYLAEAQKPKPDPKVIQDYVRMNLERQQEFNLKPGSAAPIPRSEALSIGRDLSNRTLVQGKDVKLADVRASIYVQYQALQEMYGEFTDEVILYSLSEYKGMGKNTADLLTSYMQTIQAGGDPFKSVRGASLALDRDQVEGVSNIDQRERFGGVGSFRQIWGSSGEGDAANELRLRAGETEEE